MRILRNVLLYIYFGIVAIVSLPFLFVELRNFFSFEFMNMNSPFLNGLAYSSRSLYFLLMLALAVFTILFIATKRKFCIILFMTAVALFAGAIFSLKLYESYISLILIGVTFFQLAFISIGFFKKGKEEEPSSCLVND